MDKINLEKIIRSHFNASYYDSIADLIDKRATTDDITDIIKDACRQVLERAADNAKMDVVVLRQDEIAIEFGNVINKQSILNTINEVE